MRKRDQNRLVGNSWNQTGSQSLEENTYPDQPRKIKLFCPIDGCSEATSLGLPEGSSVGAVLGLPEGSSVGAVLGLPEGSSLGLAE